MPLISANVIVRPPAADPWVPELATGSENPGTWNASAAVDNPQAWTIAIRGRLP